MNTYCSIIIPKNVSEVKNRLLRVRQFAVLSGLTCLVLIGVWVWQSQLHTLVPESSPVAISHDSPDHLSPSSVKEEEAAPIILPRQAVQKPDLETSLREAVEKGIRPDQLAGLIAVPPSIDSGSIQGRYALGGGVRFAADRDTMTSLQRSIRFVFWTLVAGNERPVIGIYWDQQNVPRLFKGWLSF